MNKIFFVVLLGTSILNVFGFGGYHADPANQDPGYYHLYPDQSSELELPKKDYRSFLNPKKDLFSKKNEGVLKDSASHMVIINPVFKPMNQESKCD